MRFKLYLGCAVLAALPALAQDPGSLRITNLALTAQGWLLGWAPSDTGRAYMVQYQDSPVDRIWRVPGSPVAFPLASNSWLDHSITNAGRFYRVAAVPAAERGTVLSASLQSTVSAFYLTLIFNLGGIPISPQYNVRLYKVRYETIDPVGARTVASGALLLPENTGRTLPLVSYQHGTITQTNLAPSAMTSTVDLDSEVVIGLALATTGYAVSMPDYLGLGDSPGLHPFHHARSEATACVDMLRAVRTLCSTNGFPLNSRLFLAGYSQGGHATMSLCRELETYHTSEFTITACAPMAGAYDLSGVTTTNFLAGNPAPNPYYLLFFLAAYQQVYGLGSSLADLLAPPYNTTLPPLMNGNTSGADLNTAMGPGDPLHILKPDYLAEFRSNSRHPLRLAMQDNDLYRWRPVAPMRLYHCAADQDVIAANSQVAYASFQSLGATQVELFDPAPAADHTGCAQPSLLLVKAWFDSLR